MLMNHRSRQRGMGTLIMAVFLVVWLAAIAACLMLVYNHLHDHKKQYLEPAKNVVLPLPR